MSKNFQLKATLVKAATQEPLPNKTINFYYRTPTGSYVAFGNPKTTDENGVALSDVVTLTDQEYWFKAEFPGDSLYDASYAEAQYKPKAPAAFDISQMLMLMLMFMLMFMLMSMMSFILPEFTRE